MDRPEYLPISWKPIIFPSKTLMLLQSPYLHLFYTKESRYLKNVKELKSISFKNQHQNLRKFALNEIEINHVG